MYCIFDQMHFFVYLFLFHSFWVALEAEEIAKKNLRIKSFLSHFCKGRCFSIDAAVFQILIFGIAL